MDAEFACAQPVTALFGPSGSGKTSIVETIAGLLRPDDGFVQLGERTLLDTKQRIALPLNRRRVGLVAQDRLLFPHLTVLANLRYGLPRSQRGGSVELNEVIELLELSPLLDRFPQALSGGERQRVALGRAIASSPELLLLDEPLTALDEALKWRIVAYLERAIARWQIPVLLVSHGQAEVRRLAREVVVLERGRVVASGPPEAALTANEPLGWRDSSGPVNMLRLDAVTQYDGQWIGSLGAQSLWLPPPAQPPGDTMFVEFAPGAVLLGRNDGQDTGVQNLSARNRLRGVVRQMREVPGGVFVAVDVGQVLWAELTPSAVAELSLSPGVEVTCLLKVHSLTLIG